MFQLLLICLHCWGILTIRIACAFFKLLVQVVNLCFKGDHLPFLGIYDFSCLRNQKFVSIFNMSHAFLVKFFNFQDLLLVFFLKAIFNGLNFQRWNQINWLNSWIFYLIVGKNGFLEIDWVTSIDERQSIVTNFVLKAGHYAFIDHLLLILLDLLKCWIYL